MPSPPVSPPPTQSAMTQQDGKPSPSWGRWFQQLWDKLHGGTGAGGILVARLIVATSTSATTDFRTLEAGDRVLVIPTAAGNSRFVTVAANGTLPIAAVVGTLYVVLRAF